MKLTFGEHLKLATTEGTKALPYVGPFFSWYCSYKETKESKRIQEFIMELTSIIEELELKIEDLSENSKAIIALALDKVSKNVSEEIIEEKRKAYINYIRNLFLNCIKDDLILNEIELFLSTLENITLLEIQILKKIHEATEIDIRNIHIDNVDSYLILTTCHNLKNKGLLVSGDVTSIYYITGMGHTAISDVKFSEYGSRFVEYCLEMDE